MKNTQNDYHVRGSKNLSDAMSDFSLTMQHAVRQNIRQDLIQRAENESGVLPPFSATEMFDYLLDSDSDFLNWMFPFCATVLTKERMSHIHRYLLGAIRQELETQDKQDQKEESELEKQKEQNRTMSQQTMLAEQLRRDAIIDSWLSQDQPELVTEKQS